MKTKTKTTAADSIKTFKIPVIWSMAGVREIEAASLQEAIKLAAVTRPKGGEFIKGTLEVDPDFTSCL